MTTAAVERVGAASPVRHGDGAVLGQGDARRPGGGRLRRARGEGGQDVDDRHLGDPPAAALDGRAQDDARALGGLDDGRVDGLADDAGVQAAEEQAPARGRTRGVGAVGPGEARDRQEHAVALVHGPSRPLDDDVGDDLVGRGRGEHALEGQGRGRADPAGDGQGRVDRGVGGQRHPAPAARRGAPQDAPGAAARQDDGHGDDRDHDDDREDDGHRAPRPPAAQGRADGPLGAGDGGRFGRRGRPRAPLGRGGDGPAPGPVRRRGGGRGPLGELGGLGGLGGCGRGRGGVGGGPAGALGLGGAGALDLAQSPAGQRPPVGRGGVLVGCHREASISDPGFRWSAARSRRGRPGGPWPPGGRRRARRCGRRGRAGPAAGSARRRGAG